MKKTMNRNIGRQTWLSAVAQAAKSQALELPPVTTNGMGSARTPAGADGRFVTFKRRLVPMGQAEIDGVEWVLWREQDGLPMRVTAFREPLDPKPENFGLAMPLLKGWLVDRWTPEKAQAEVGKHLRAQTVDEPRDSGDQKRDAEICSV
jgi:hypothetical protein